jgi:hypothetical protein
MLLDIFRICASSKKSRVPELQHHTTHAGDRPTPRISKSPHHQDGQLDLARGYILSSHNI